jgi:tripartite-type tricarboxylate transporter receptor subunit TctC
MLRKVFAVLLLSAAMVMPVVAQEYKSIISPGSPGSVTDIMSRSAANVLGLPVLSHPGAGGVLGAIAASKEPKSLYSTSDSLIISPLILKNVAYNPDTFVPVYNFGMLVNALGANSKLPFDTFEGMVKYAKANPGKLTVGIATAKTSPHISMLALNKELGLDILIVPYTGQGAPLGILDTVAGRVDMFFHSAGSMTPHVKTGNLKLLAVSTKTRLPEYPKVPSILDFVPELQSSGWLFLAMHRTTPIADQEKYNLIFQDKFPEIAKKLSESGLDMYEFGGDLKSTHALFDRQKKNWKKQVELSGIQPE